VVSSRIEEVKASVEIRFISIASGESNFEGREYGIERIYGCREKGIG